MEKVLSQCQENKRHPPSQEVGNTGLRRLHKQTDYFFTKSIPNTNLALSILHNFIVGLKAACCGPFRESQVFMGFCMSQITFLLTCLMLM